MSFLGTPSSWIQRWAHLANPQAFVLDVACGSGRHAAFFAQRGCRVTAVDRDSCLAEMYREQAEIQFVCADLESGAAWPWEEQRFDVIVVTNYLYRPLFPSLLRLLADQGVLLYETFAQGQQHYGRPTNADYLLLPGELLQHCRQLRVLGYEDGVVNHPQPARVQRICARQVSASVDKELDQHPLLQLKV